MSRLILIRHAQSVADSIVEVMHHDPLYRVFLDNMRHRLPIKERRAMARELHRKYNLPCGINDVELTPESTPQIVILGRFLSAMKVQPKNIWCSPLVRTRATLEHLTVLYPDLAKAVTTLDDRLIERQRGGEAAEFADLQLYLALNPHELARKKQCPPLRYAPPGGECFHDVRTRVALVLQEILTALRYGDTLVVTHHSVIHSFRSQLENWPEGDFLTTLIGDKPPNCGVLIYNLVGNAMSLVCRSW